MRLVFPSVVVTTKAFARKLKKPESGIKLFACLLILVLGLFNFALGQIVLVLVVLLLMIGRARWGWCQDAQFYYFIAFGMLLCAFALQFTGLENGANNAAAYAYELIVFGTVRAVFGLRRVVPSKSRSGNDLIL
jgi:hypothetical protein